VGILRWVAWDSSEAMVEGIVDAGEEKIDMFAASQ
jgi:hypothetical protein